MAVKESLPTEVADFLRVLYPIIILNTLSVGMLWPAIPAILEIPFNGDSAGVARLSTKISAANAVLDFVTNPVLGSLSDAHGRRPFLLQSLFVAACCNAVVAIFGTTMSVVFTRLAFGVCNISKAMVYAMIADVMEHSATTQPARVKVFGLIGVASGCGFALGPAVGGLVGALCSPFVTVAVASATVGASALLVFFNVNETHRVERTGGVTNRPHRCDLRSPLEHAVRVVVQNRSVARFSIPFVLSGIAAGPYAIWYYYSEAKYGWTYSTISSFLALYGVASVAAQGLLLPALTPNVLNESATVTLGFFANSMVFVLYGLLTEAHGLLPFAVLPLCAIGNLSEPVLRKVFSQLVTQQEQGALQGALAALSTFSNACGPLLASTLLTAGSSKCTSSSHTTAASSTCSRLLLGTPFFVSSALFILSSVTAAISFLYWGREDREIHSMTPRHTDDRTETLPLLRANHAIPSESPRPGVRDK